MTTAVEAAVSVVVLPETEQQQEQQQQQEEEEEDEDEDELSSCAGVCRRSLRRSSRRYSGLCCRHDDVDKNGLTGGGIPTEIEFIDRVSGKVLPPPPPLSPIELNSKHYRRRSSRAVSSWLETSPSSRDGSAIASELAAATGSTMAAAADENDENVSSPKEEDDDKPKRSSSPLRYVRRALHHFFQRPRRLFRWWKKSGSADNTAMITLDDPSSCAVQQEQEGTEDCCPSREAVVTEGEEKEPRGDGTTTTSSSNPIITDKEQCTRTQTSSKMSSGLRLFWGTLLDVAVPPRCKHREQQKEMKGKRNGARCSLLFRCGRSEGETEDKVGALPDIISESTLIVFEPCRKSSVCSRSLISEGMSQLGDHEEL